MTKQTSAHPPARDGLPQPQRTWAMIAISVSITLAVLDSAMINVALPTIARSIDATAAASVWVIKAYQLAIIAAMLPLASLGEAIGYRRVYQGGLLLFALASFICAQADSLSTLTAARLLQGLGAAGIMSVNTALVRFIFPRHALGRGIGISAFVVATSASAGPTIAAAVLAVADWHWLFAINVPLGLTAFLLALRLLPATPTAPRRFDYASAALNAATFSLLILAIDRISRPGPPYISLLLAATAVGSGWLLVRRQLSVASPMLPVDLLRIPVFALSVATSACSFVAQMLAFVSLPFYLQDVLGRSAVETGLLMTPWALLVAATAPVAGRLADRYAAGLLAGAGLLLLAGGLFMLALLPEQPGSSEIVWRMAVCGFGFALFQAPNNRALLSSAPMDRSGGASGMLGTARLTGQASGAALAALIFSWGSTAAASQALVVAAAFAATGAVVSTLRLMND